MRTSTLFLVTGGLLLLGGILALANPLAASLAVTSLVGILFLVSGVLQLWILFRAGEMGNHLWNAVIASLTVVVGVWLLAKPLQGAVSLTLVLGVVFFFMGIVRLAIGSRLGGSPLKWMMFLSGAGSLGIGLIVFFDVGAAATTLLGILLGVQLLVEGIGLLALGLMGRGD